MSFSSVRNQMQPFDSPVQEQCFYPYFSYRKRSIIDRLCGVWPSNTYILLAFGNFLTLNMFYQALDRSADPRGIC